jgi:putative ABC transport system permease protein
MYIRPPKTGEKLLKFLLRKRDHSAVMGDIEEIYYDILEEKGSAYAGLWYWCQIVKSIPGFIFNTVFWSGVMFKNYLKLTVRILLKNKVFSFINISGLSTGMACCIVIFLFVQDELSWDRFHEYSDQIYRVNTEWKYSTTGETLQTTHTLYSLAQYLKDDLPEVENAVRICRFITCKVRVDDREFNEIVHFADPDFLKVFSFPLIKGDNNTALDNPNSIIITKDFALKYFGAEDPMGKTVNIQGEGDFTVTGILNIPHNSHFRPNFLVSYKAVEKEAPKIVFFRLVTTYILLREGAATETVEAKLPELTKKYYSGQREAEDRLYLQALTDIHTGSNIDNELGENSDIKYSYVYSIIALIIIVIACINFMNLSTARASRRAKEVGIRKVAGARRNQLIRQFVGESIIIAFLSLIAAVLLAIILIPFFNEYTGKQLSIDFINNSLLYLALLALTIVVGIAAGSYPAYFSSAFNPIDVIKQNRPQGVAGIIIRKGLVVTQYVISLVFIIGTIIVLSQVNFIKKTPLGFGTENIVTMGIVGNFTPFELIKNEFMSHPGIIDVTHSYRFIEESGSPVKDFVPEGFSEDASLNMSIIGINYDFFDFYGINIIEGRGFSSEYPSDIENTIILNKTAVNQLGWDFPIGKKIINERRKMDATVIGIVEDIHNVSLYNQILPTVYQYDPRRYYLLSVKIRSEDMQGTLTFLANKWKELNLMPNFRYKFLDEEISRFYIEEEKTKKVFTFASILSVFLASLGLFGLATFSAEQRIKEIGIRKVLGSTVPGIVFLLSKDFYKLVVVANIIASPIAYFIMNRWLQNFAYRISISWLIFIAAGLLVFTISLITISYQSIKAATANPVESLRYE